MVSSGFSSYRNIRIVEQCKNCKGTGYYQQPGTRGLLPCRACNAQKMHRPNSLCRGCDGTGFVMEDNSHFRCAFCNPEPENDGHG